MGLGSYPDVPLGEAREKAGKSRKLADNGVDPIDARQVDNQGIPTFVSCAAQYMRSHRRSWKSGKHAHQWVRTLKTYARPVLSTKTVDQVTTEDILQILSPIWTTKTETAKRLQGRIESILDYAAARKFRDPLNPARWRGHLDAVLPRPSRVKKPTHHPAMPYDEIPTFFRELRENQCPSSFALQLMILTAARTNEILGARWDEVNVESALWTIPEQRMKSGREHRVPLSDTALDVLQQIPRIDGSPFIFNGARHKNYLSNMAILQLMRGMGFGSRGSRGNYVPHGFRSSFRDWSGEISSFPRDVAEMALAHSIGNKVEAAYRRGDLFEKRRKMMQQWANFVTKENAKIVALHRLSTE